MCKIGATLSNADDKTIEALTEFGFHLGMTFQIIDDLLDLTSTSEALGKPAGNDIREGNYTLPVILAIQDNPSLKEKLQQEDELDATLKIVREEKYISKTKIMALEHVEKATLSLENTQLNEEVKSSFIKLLSGLTQRAS